MFAATLALTLALVAGANAHLYWYAPTEGDWPAIPDNNKLQCNAAAFAAVTLPSDYVTVTPGGSFASPPYNVSVNAHGGGNMTMEWYPCTTGNATGTRTYGTIVDFAPLSGGSTFVNGSDVSVPVAGTYPSGISSWGVIQMTSCTVQNGCYIACRWAYAGAAPAATTGAATGASTTTTTSSGGSSTTTTAASTTGESKSSAATLAAGMVSVAAVALSL